MTLQRVFFLDNRLMGALGELQRPAESHQERPESRH